MSQRVPLAEKGHMERYEGIRRSFGNEIEQRLGAAYRRHMLC